MNSMRKTFACISISILSVGFEREAIGGSDYAVAGDVVADDYQLSNAGGHLPACVGTDSFDADGYTWISACWPVYLTKADPAVLQQMVDGGILMPPVRSCYEAVFADAHLCVVSVDGVSLLARPTLELGTLSNAAVCPAAAGWSIKRSSVDGHCWAMVDGFAVRVWEG